MIKLSALLLIKKNQNHAKPDRILKNVCEDMQKGDYWRLCAAIINNPEVSCN